MDAITALTERVSVALLEAPGPNAEQMEKLKGAALRAADHGHLTPWRFLIIEGEGRDALGQLFASALARTTPDSNEAALDRIRAKPQRAPTIIVAIASCQPHNKIPRDEQLMSAACAVQGLITAAFAMGIGAYWRTGEMAYDESVRCGLGVGAQEEIIGYVYLGTPAKPVSGPRLRDPSHFFEEWEGPIDP